MTYFEDQLNEARQLSKDLESLKDEVFQTLPAGELRLIESVEDARDALEVIMEDRRYDLLRTGEEGLAIRRQLATSRAARALDSDDQRKRRHISKRFDLIDDLQEDIDERGEQAVIRQLESELAALLEVARERTDTAMAELRLMAPSEQ